MCLYYLGQSLQCNRLTFSVIMHIFLMFTQWFNMQHTIRHHVVNVHLSARQHLGNPQCTTVYKGKGSGSIVLKHKERKCGNIREVLQTEFRFRFRKGPRLISAGPGCSTPEEVEPNFLFCKPNFLFRFGSINSKKCVVLATRCIVMSKNTTEKLNLCLLLDHYSWN